MPAANSIAPPYEVFFDADGAPLENGRIFIGAQGQNPETAPIAVYWDVDLTQPAAQPIRTLNGVPSRNGSPGTVYVAESDYSITVRDRALRLVYTTPFQLNRLSAAMVGYLPAGAGAVATTVRDKLTESVSVEDFGAVGDGAVDDIENIRKAVAAAVLAGVKLKFPKTKVFAVSETLSLAGINNFTIDFNNSVLKATASMTHVIEVDECSHISLNKPGVDGNALAQNGIALISSTGVACHFNEIHKPTIYNCLTSNLRFGDYTESGNDYAVDRNSVYQPRLYQALYNVFSDSLNALNNNIYEGSCSKLGTSSVNSPLHDVYAKRGTLNVYDLYTVGAMRDDYDSWVFRIDDGRINVFGGYSEAGYNFPNCGQIYMGPRIATDAGEQSNFYGWRCLTRGWGGATIPAGTITYQDNGSNDLNLDGCSFHKFAYTSVNAVPCRVHSTAQLISKGNHFLNCPKSPFRAELDGGVIGRVISSGDKTSQDGGATWNLTPSVGYDTHPYIDMTSHDVTGTTNETDMGSVTLPEYFLNNRGGLEIFASGIISGGGIGTKTIKLYIGTTSVTMYAATNQYAWEIRATVFNTATNAQRITASITTSGGGTSNISTYLTSTQNTANTLTVKLTGQLTVSTETIGQRMMSIKRL